MSSEPVQTVLDALAATTGKPPTRVGSGWSSPCPAHDDRRPSLSISEADDGRALVHCHAGCTPEAICEALGLSLSDLMRDNNGQRPSAGSKAKPDPTIYATARDAIAELERRHGTRSATWTYEDFYCEPTGVVVRFDGPNGKTYRPVHRNGDGWAIGSMPVPRTLYRLPELPDATRVYVCEGEKCVDALRELGLTATASPHGSKSARKANWQHLAGKTCIILPDADDAGQRYADDVAGILLGLTPTPTVKRVQLPDLPEGGDAVEHIGARRSEGLTDDEIRAELERLADDAEPIRPAEPTTPTPESYQEFPTHILPEPMRSFIDAASTAIGCDPALVALPCLAVVGAAIGNTRVIRLKSGAWSEPPIIWAACVVESGAKKSPAFDHALQPVERLERKARDEHRRAIAEYNESKAGCGKGDPKPDPPICQRYATTDCTIEALVSLLADAPRGLLVARDELSGLVGGFDQYKSKRTRADAAHYLSTWQGRPVRIDRKTGDPGQRSIYVHRAAVSIVGTVQPAIFGRVLGDEHFADGLAARFLLAMPPRRSVKWTDADIAPTDADAWAALVAGLYELDFAYTGDGEPYPKPLAFSPEGKAAWVAFYNDWADRLAAASGDTAAMLAKLEAYAARLSLIVHCVRSVAGDSTLQDADRIDADSVRVGVELIRWFACEAERVYRAIAAAPEDRERAALVAWIKERGGQVTANELAHARRRFRGRSDLARAALEDLVAAGAGWWEYPAPGPKGGRPAQRFVLGVTVTETPTHDSAAGGLGSSDTVDKSEGGLDDQIPPELLHVAANAEPIDVGVGELPHADADQESEVEEWTA